MPTLVRWNLDLTKSLGTGQIRFLNQGFVISRFFSIYFRPSKKKKNMFLVRISVKKRAAGRFFLVFIISYCMFSLHIITFPQGYVGALRSNIYKTKHQILIKHKFV